MTVRRTITMLVVAGSTACFTKPERPSEPIVDAPPPPPHVLVVKNGNNNNASTLTLMMRVPAGTQFLLAAVQVGAQCGDTVPTVLEVNAAGVQLTRLETIVGTMCGGGSRSEQWALLQPPTGDPVPITFVLGGPALSLHTVALALDGVDQTTPVRTTKTTSGRGIDSTIDIESAPGDLVIDTIGQGNTIMAPGFDQERLFTMNQSSTTTLDNSGASSQPGASSVTMTWNFQQDDEWQTIATSIRAAP